MFRTKTTELQTTTERYFWRTVAVLNVGNLFIGLGFMYGLALTPAFQIASNIVPMPVWGIVAFSAAMLTLCGIITHSRNLLVAGLALGSFYTLCLALTFVGGLITDYRPTAFTGIVWWLVIGTIHIMAALGLPSGATIKGLRNGA